MPIAHAPVTIQASGTVSVPLGGLGTVGAVVIANESPYGIQATAGAGGQWIAAQTVDIMYCNVTGWTGSISLTTNDYLSNATNAPSFIVLLTVYAPGETIPGTYPAALMRLANGLIGVADQLINDNSAATSLIAEMRPVGQTQSFFSLYNDGQADWWVLRSDGVAQEIMKVINQAGGKGGQLLFPGGWFAGGSQSVQVDTLGNIFATGTVTAGAPVTLAAGNQQTAYASVSESNAIAGKGLGTGVTFPAQCTNAPTSLTFTADTTLNNGGPNASFFHKWGCNVFVVASANGNTTWSGSVTTVGNCLVAVDPMARTFDHHCDGCGATARAIPVSALRIEHDMTGNPSIAYDCPCGVTEVFNPRLTAADEADTAIEGHGAYVSTRGERSALIRRLMGLAKLPVK